jgi:hypothetical protein
MERSDPAVKLIRSVINSSHAKKVFKQLLSPFTTSRQRFMLGVRAKNLTVRKPVLPRELRKDLIERYRDDILKLQELIKRDLSKWLEVE